LGTFYYPETRLLIGQNIWVLIGLNSWILIDPDIVSDPFEHFKFLKENNNFFGEMILVFFFSAISQISEIFGLGLIQDWIFCPVYLPIHLRYPVLICFQAKSLSSDSFSNTKLTFNPLLNK